MTNEEKYKTAEERVKAFGEFCDNNECMEGCAALCNRDRRKIMSCDCMAYWLTLEAEDEKPMPCPFCGGETHNNLGHLKVGVVHYWVDCISPDCMYRSAHYTDKNVAIAAHNRVYRAVKAYKESEVAE